MDETLIIDRIGWCRESARHRYVGSLWGSSDGIRLVGRDAEHGIEVSLAVPLGEIDRACLELTRSEAARGEPCLVLTLAESSPLLVWEIGAHDTTLRDVVERIAELRRGAVGPLAMACHEQ